MILERHLADGRRVTWQGERGDYFAAHPWLDDYGREVPHGLPNRNLHGGTVKVVSLVVLLVLLETGGVTYFWFYIKEMKL
ncbi:Uncharacterised protein [Limosilactobacillus oris]|nr:Uncharacterised protein [Limosilactobacillus oris]